MCVCENVRERGKKEVFEREGGREREMICHGAGGGESGEGGVFVLQCVEVYGWRHVCVCV